MRNLYRAVVAGALATGLLLGACSPSEDQDAGSDPTTSASPGTASNTATTPAEPTPAPRAGRCYRLSFDEAVSPESEVAPVGCAKKHTAQTFHVGTLDLLQDGHLLAVDSRRAREQVTSVCRDRLRRHVGGDVRLSMLAAVWFTPDHAAADTGADWFRCDVVALAGDDTLAQLPRRSAGLLTGDGANAWAMCGTAAPGTRGFNRVPCSARHTWRALRAVELSGSDYPDGKAVAAAMATPCRDAARDVAADPLDVEWSEEAPTKQQWRSGRRYGLCWAPAG